MSIEIFFGENQRVNARLKDTVVYTDQPVESGGENSAPSPFVLFLSSIGTCAGYYIRSFCQERKISTDNIKIVQKMVYDHNTHLISDIIIEVELGPDFPDKYKNALLNVINQCKVKKHIEKPPKINTVIK